MAQVTVLVNGRSFRMGCRDGEETRVQELAAEIDAHVQRIKGSAKAQDERIFLMVAMMMADELSEAREEIQKLRQGAADPRSLHVIEGGAQAMQRDLSRALEAAPKTEAPQKRANG